MATTSTQSMPNGDLRAKEFDEVGAHQLSLQWPYGTEEYLKGAIPTTPPPASIHNTIPNGNEYNTTDAVLPILYFPIGQAIGNTAIPGTWNPATPTSSTNTRRLYLYNGNSLYAPVKSGWWLTYANKTDYRGFPIGGDYMYNGVYKNYSNLPYTTQSAIAIGNDITKTFLKYVGGSNVTAYVGPRSTGSIEEIQYASVKNSLSVGAGLTSSQLYYVFATNGSVKRPADDYTFQQPLPFKVYFCGYYSDLLSLNSYNQLILFPGISDYYQYLVGRRATFNIIPAYNQTFYYHDVRMGTVDAGTSTERFVMYVKIGTYYVNPSHYLEYELHFYKDKNYFDVHYISSGTSTPSSSGNGIYYSSSSVYITDSNGYIHPSLNYPGPKYFIGDGRAIRVTTSVNGYNAYSQGYDLGKIVDSRLSINSNNSLSEYQLQITNPMGYTFTNSTFGSNTNIYSINIVKNTGLASKVSDRDYQITGELDEVSYDWSAAPGTKMILTPQGNLYVNGQFDDVTLNT